MSPSGSKPARGPRGSRLREFLRQRWLSIVLIIVAVIFVFQNLGTVTITIFAVTVSAPLWLILLLTFLIGLLAGWVRMRRR